MRASAIDRFEQWGQVAQRDLGCVKVDPEPPIVRAGDKACHVRIVADVSKLGQDHAGETWGRRTQHGVTADTPTLPEGSSASRPLPGHVKSLRSKRFALYATGVDRHRPLYLA